MMLVDDHPMVLEGLQNMIGMHSPEFEIVGVGHNGEEALSLARELRPDVVLMDIRMPVKDGIAAIREIKREDPAPRVIVLTTFDDDDLIVRALQAGADGYLLKDVTAPELRAALRSVRDGYASISPAVATKMARRLAAQSLEQAPEERETQSMPEAPKAQEEKLLSNREMEVLRLMARGCDNQTIAARLGISWGTVKNHISHIYEKLGVSDRAQAVLRALRLGLIDLDSYTGRDNGT